MPFYPCLEIKHMVDEPPYCREKVLEKAQGKVLGGKPKVLS